MLYGQAINSGAWTIHRALIFGLLFGMSYYNMELILPFLVVISVTNLIAHVRLWSVASGTVFFAGVVTGLLPLLVYNAMHSWSNFKHIISNASREPILTIPGKVYSLFTAELPRFFQARNVDAIVAADLLAWIDYLIYLSLITWLIVVHLVLPVLTKGPDTNWSRARQVFRASFPIVLVTGMIGVYLLVYAGSHSVKLSSRYFLPVFPLFVILASAALVALWSRKSLVARSVALTTIVFFLLHGAVAYSFAIGNSEVVDEVYILQGRVVNRMTDGDAPLKIRDYLEMHSIRHVSCGDHLRWRLVFESNESIIASSMLFGGYPRYEEHDLAVRNADRVATILHRDDYRLKDYILATERDFDNAVIANYVVFTPKQKGDVW